MNPVNSITSQYDVIITGAGLSGLIAAAYLLKEGAHVLVCEQAGQVGGLFNSFRREGYQFDCGIKAVENSAVMMPMLAQLDLLGDHIVSVQSYCSYNWWLPATGAWFCRCRGIFLHVEWTLSSRST